METYTFDETHIGTVVKVDKENRRIGVYLPKLMPGMDSGEEISYKVPTNAGLTINDITTNISNTVTKTNYIWARSYDYNAPLPKVGSKVIIEFLDDVCSQCYWAKFNPNNDYEVIDEEKYPKLYKITLGNKEYEISENDKVIIDVPKYYKVNEVVDKDSNKHFEIKDNFHFYFHYGLEESISKLQKSIEFLEGQYEETFITGLNNIKYDFTIPPDAKSTVSSETLITSFESYRDNAFKNIKKSNDLAVSNDEFKYYSTLLNGLIASFNNFKEYKKSYETVFATGYPEKPTPIEIDESLTSIFQKAEKIATHENVADYVEYITDMYSMTSSVVYTYYNEKEELIKTQQDHTTFTKLGDRILPLDSSACTPNIHIVNPEETVLAKAWTFINWRDKSGNTLTPEYLIFHDIVAEPVFHGLYLSGKPNVKPQVSVINDDEAEYTISATVDINTTNSNKTKTFNSLSELNNYLLSDNFNESVKTLTVSMTVGKEITTLIWNNPSIK